MMADRIASRSDDTNLSRRGFLASAAAHPDFVAGRIDTGFIERHLDELVAPTEPSNAVKQAAVHIDRHRHRLLVAEAKAALGGLPGALGVRDVAEGADLDDEAAVRRAARRHRRDAHHAARD